MIALPNIRYSYSVKLAHAYAALENSTTSVMLALAVISFASQLITLRWVGVMNLGKRL